jgi:hypothetical protein
MKKIIAVVAVTTLLVTGALVVVSKDQPVNNAAIGTINPNLDPGGGA